MRVAFAVVSCMPQFLFNLQYKVGTCANVSCLWLVHTLGITHLNGILPVLRKPSLKFFKFLNFFVCCSCIHKLPHAMSDSIDVTAALSQMYLRIARLEPGGYQDNLSANRAAPFQRLERSRSIVTNPQRMQNSEVVSTLPEACCIETFLHWLRI